MSKDQKILLHGYKATVTFAEDLSDAQFSMDMDLWNVLKKYAGHTFALEGDPRVDVYICVRDPDARASS